MKKILFSIVLFSLSISGQSPYKEVYQKSFFKGKYPQKIPVLMRTYPVYIGNGLFRVYLPVQIKYNFFQFLYKKDIYSAAAEIEVSIENSESKTIATRIWQTELKVDNFKSTHSKTRFLFSMDSIDLSPGQYHVLFKYKDLNGEQRLSFKQSLTLPIVEAFYASLPLYFHPNQPLPKHFAGLAYEPSSLITHWDFNRDLGIYFQFWRNDTSMSIPTSLELINGETGKIVFAMDTAFSEAGHRQTFSTIVPADSLEESNHRLKVVYRYAEDSTRHIIPINIIWFDKPLSLWDKDLTLEPIKYIVDQEVFEKLSEGDDEEQRQKVKQFWKTRDPTPQSPYNELKTEFYSRVDSTLKLFSNRNELGWRTDLGKIYISHGPPEKIEDHSLDPIPNPFMRWIYYQDGKRIEYTFRAIDGRKEYKLTESREIEL